MDQTQQPSKDGNPTQAKAGEENEQVQDSQPEQDTEGSRLLKESKKFKERALAAERELEKLRKAELEQQGKYKEMYEKSEEKYHGLLKNLVKERIRTSVMETASRAGCVNVDALLKLGNPSLLEYDEESQAVHGSELFVEDAKRSHPYLFQSAKPPTINPATPGGVSAEKKLTATEIAKLPIDQRLLIMEQLMSKK